MSKYDFSKITTDELAYGICHYLEYECSCDGITCIRCPFYNKSICSRDEEVHRLFKEELARRQGMENNKMPELESGMLVETDRGELYIVLPDCSGKLGFYDFNGIGSFNYIDTVITKVYKLNSASNYYRFFTDKHDLNTCFSIIWEKESTKDKKIKEIKNTIKELNKQIEDLENE